MFPHSSLLKSFGISSRHASHALAVLIILSLSAGTVSAQGAGGATPLRLGWPVEREIRAGQTHVYSLTVRAGQYVQVSVEQLGVDVLAKMLTPDGQMWAKAYGRAGTEGYKTLSSVVEVTGGYHLEVQPAQAEGGGKYRVLLEALRTATEQDTAFLAASRIHNEAYGLTAEGNKESLQRAIPKYEEALGLFRATGKRQNEAKLLHHLGFTYYSLGEHQKALESYAQAVSIYRELQDLPGEAYVTNDIAGIYSARDEDEKALEYYQKVIPLLRQLRYRRAEALALVGIGLAHRHRGAGRKALESYGQALTLLRAVGDRVSESKTLRDIGIIHDLSGEMPQAIAHYTRALNLARAGGDWRTEADALIRIGLLYANRGERQKAIDHIGPAKNLYEAAQDFAGTARVYFIIARVYESFDERQKALEFYDAASRLYVHVEDREGLCETSLRMGELYRDTDFGKRSLVYYLRALDLSREIGNLRLEAATLERLGDLGVEWGLNESALENYQKALDIFRKIESRTGEAFVINSLGELYTSTGEKGKALGYFTRALAIQREVGHRAQESSTLMNLGSHYASAGERRKALGFFRRALTITRTIRERARIAHALTHIARVVRDQGHLSQALRLVEEALSLMEYVHGQYGTHDLRADFFYYVTAYYDFYIDLLMMLHWKYPKAGYNVIAFHASERAHARSLLETLNEAGAGIAEDADPAQVERARVLRHRAFALSQRQLRLKDDETRLEKDKEKYEDDFQLALEMEWVRNELQRVEAHIRRASPRYAALTQPPTPTLREIQTGLLDADTVLLEFFVGLERSYLWVVTPDALHSFQLPKGTDIQEAALSYYSLLKDAGRWKIASQSVVRGGADLWMLERASAFEPATALSRMLLSPAAKLLRGKRLLVVADGALHYLPFGALPDPSTAGKAGGYLPLLLEHEVVNLPSASSLLTIGRQTKDRKPPTKTLTVLADPIFESTDERIERGGATPPANEVEEEAGQPPRLPPAHVRSALESGMRAAEGRLQRLPGTRIEAERILALVPPDKRMQALDFAASRETATGTDIGRYRYVHFATHGFLNSVHPEFSGLVLSLFDERGTPRDGFLQAHEIYNLNLSADLVVLSACQTGLGKEIKGEGLVGLTRGFMYAGAPRVVVSLWSVSDDATAELMSRFYYKLIKGGMRPAQALREAQLSLLKEERWAAPYYWAAFTLQGEWR